MIEYDVVLIPAEEGGYTAIVPTLPGCISEGDTEEETLANIKDIIEGWLIVARKRGLEIPAGGKIKLTTVEVTVW